MKIRLFISREYELFNNVAIYGAYCAIWDTYGENKLHHINVTSLYI